MMPQRQATADEIARAYRDGQRVRFEHWARETYSPRARKGVAQRTHSTAKVQSIGGVPHVRYLGQMYQLKATYFHAHDGCRAFVSCATIR